VTGIFRVTLARRQFLSEIMEVLGHLLADLRHFQLNFCPGWQSCQKFGERDRRLSQSRVEERSHELSGGQSNSSTING
jgi:hypothetical protein